MLVRLIRDRRAGVAPLLALAALPIVGLTGAAVDYSRANSARTAMQGALDSTALMLARDVQSPGGTQFDAKAVDYFRSNFSHPEVADVAVTFASSSSAGAISVTVSATGWVKTLFMGVVGFSTLAISVHSSAMASADGLGCVLSLNSSAHGAISGQGSASVVLNGCSLYDNSQNSAALAVGGSARISALSVDVVGGISGGSNITATQSIRSGVGPIADPYAAVAFPIFYGCSQQNFSAKTTMTIDPGVYCGGMAINAGADVTLNPGIYYLDGGSFFVNGGATISGSSVTLVFTSRNRNGWATATVNGNATVNLTPPKSGPTAGIVIFGDRQIPPGTSFKFNGGASQYFGGAIYLPTAAIDFSGGVATGMSCTQLIGDTINFVGNASLAINCNNYQTRPFSQTVIKLVS